MSLLPTLLRFVGSSPVWSLQRVCMGLTFLKRLRYVVSRLVLLCYIMGRYTVYTDWSLYGHFTTQYATPLYDGQMARYAQHWWIIGLTC